MSGKASQLKYKAAKPHSHNATKLKKVLLDTSVWVSYYSVTDLYHLKRKFLLNKIVNVIINYDLKSSDLQILATVIHIKPLEFHSFDGKLNREYEKYFKYNHYDKK